MKQLIERRTQNTNSTLKTSPTRNIQNHQAKTEPIGETSSLIQNNMSHEAPHPHFGPYGQLQTTAFSVEDSIDLNFPLDQEEIGAFDVESYND
jgi:hypothetical protein